jgi:hypothetical protein
MHISSSTQDDIKSEERKNAEQEQGIVQGMEEKEPILTQRAQKKILDKKPQK